MAAQWIRIAGTASIRRSLLALIVVYLALFAATSITVSVLWHADPAAARSPGLALPVIA